MLTRIVRSCIPESYKKKMLVELFRLTADAFGCEMPVLETLSLQDFLREYALFTTVEAERCLREEDALEEVKHSLYQNSFRFGRDLRKSLFMLSWGKSPAALKLIYQLIGIELQYKEQGEFIIERCYFSRYYSAEVCELISSMDEGLAAGLIRGRLRFTRRITEGCSSCKGRIIK